MVFWLQFDQREQSLAWKLVITQNWSESDTVVSNSLWPNGLCSPWNSPDQNTGVDSLSLLQGIFPTQGLKPGLPHCRQISLPAEPQDKPKNTGVGSLSLLQGIFSTQDSNGGPAFQVDSLPTELSGKPWEKGRGRDKISKGIQEVQTAMYNAIYINM